MTVGDGGDGSRGDGGQRGPVPGRRGESGRAVVLPPPRTAWAPPCPSPWPSLPPAHAPRRPTETVLYGLVRQHLESFLAHAREHYEAGCPGTSSRSCARTSSVGCFSEGFTRCHCDTCGHDLLVAFSCHGRTICPSCTGRRMSNGAAHLVDRVLPDVPVRQYVLSLPFELRRLAAFKADVLAALARIFVEATFATYRARAKRAGIEGAQCGSVLCVQRFGSLNLNVHFHTLVLDGVFTRDPQGRVLFHPASPPGPRVLGAIVERTCRKATAWLRRRGYLDDDLSGQRPEAQSALDACAAVAMQRGQLATLARPGDADAADEDHERAPDKGEVAVEHQGFNLHAGVRIEAGDNLGRERLARYALRPPLSLERLRRLPGGRIAYRLKYVSRGRGKHRVMTPMEFMARLSAIVAPPRYPLVRYAGVLAPRSKWRRDVVPRPRDHGRACVAPRRSDAPATSAAGAGRPAYDGTSMRRSAPRASDELPERSSAPAAPAAPPSPPPVAPVHGSARIRPGDVLMLTPNVLSVQHWDRLLGGALYATSPRVDWAALLRRSFSIDVLQCPKCHGRLRVIAVITEREPVTRILAHVAMPTEAPPLARARDPSDELDDDEAAAQLSLELG